MVEKIISYRVCKSGWFSRAARKARIGDDELCEAIAEVVKGQADDLGGGVFKKRLNKNMYRSIILARTDGFWFYEYLFAKKDRPNIGDDELRAFRELAKGYAALQPGQLASLLDDGDLIEICSQNGEGVSR
ncbi:type II toxin-antitoxin system RelE/ParE family toxin [Asticcacaulis sp. AC402]|uniref:type II toxin-antitoxin system RelE/ParE family toxin n=1 Tax=Asticcacaulis sp. AC402 TaxID=1282361 RepID=UPI0003C3C217|nr:type II toxin-antitoxin system RelE/ParE family toxin [Asticcacaulis sp. AC402]ESQ73510.1 RelE family toxin-antitoxin system [Asticcacaulis sp. AC402]